MKPSWLLSSFFALACGSAEDGDPSHAPPRYPVPGCEPLSSAPCDVRASTCQTRLLQMAACLRREPAGDMPPITVMTEAEYADLETARQAMAPPRPTPDHDEIALGMLGLAQRGALSPQTTVAEIVEFAWGVYRWDTKDVVVIDHGDAFDDETASPVLVHEFIHALQDRDVGLMDLETAATSYDSYLATDAVIEGEATFHEARFGAAMLGLDPSKIDWTEHFQNAIELNERELLDDASAYTASFRRFPYQWGGRYMHFVWAMGGLNAVLDRFVTPPTTTLTLLQSVTAAVEDEAPGERIQSPTPPAEWTRTTQTQLGAWGVFMVLAKASPSDIDQARSLALAWRSDLFSVYESTDSTAAATTMVWQLTFDNEEHAEQAIPLLSHVTGTAVRGSGTRLIVAGTDGKQAIAWALSI